MALQSRAPPPRDSWADAVEEAKDLRGASAEDHYARLRAACALAFAILERHPEREAFLASVDPLPAEAVETLARLRGRR